MSETETKQCGQCGKEYSSDSLYYLLDLRDNEHCHDCHMENASEMVEFFMLHPWSMKKALDSVEHSKGGGFRQVLDGWMAKETD